MLCRAELRQSSVLHCLPAVRLPLLLRLLPTFIRKGTQCSIFTMLSVFEYKYIKTLRIAGHLSKVKLPENFESIQVHCNEVLVHLCCPDMQEAFALQDRDRAEPSSSVNEFP